MATPEEMREWTAKKMGYKISIHKDKVPGVSPPTFTYRTNYWSKTEGQIYWHPDIDMNQCFMLVEKMREEGWDLYISIPQRGFGLPYWPINEVVADFQKSLHGLSKPPSSFERCDKSLCHAIILAAMATEGDYIDHDGRIKEGGAPDCPKFF